MSTNNSYLLGLDFGTESVRGALFDLDGKMLHTQAETYPTFFPRPGWAEQNPDDWWQSFIRVVNKIFQHSGISSKSIVALTVDTTCCTVLALDKNFNPLRNALIWMDVRSFRQAEKIAASGMEPLKYNGFGSVSAEWMPCKALWIKENEPDVYDRAAHICEFQDWINYKLTGQFVGSINNVTLRWYYDSKSGGWPVEFYQKIGLGGVIEKYPQKILKLGEPIAKIKPDVAEQAGLSKDTLVVQGGADACIGVIGLNAVKPGRLAFITGSSHLMIGHAEEEFHKKGIFGAFPDGIMPGLFAIEGAQISTGSILKWFKDNFIKQTYIEKAKKNGLAIYDYLSSQAEKINIGSEGIILLNYWQGNRNPLVDSQARGVIWGLSLSHTPIHVYRAIMEAVCYGTEHIMRYFKDVGFKPQEVYACGGATQSDFWIQMHSDVIGVPIKLTEEHNAPLLGDAILAATGAGLYDSIEEAAEHMVKIRKTIEPDPSKTAAYQYYVDKYIATYPLLKDLMHDMLSHEMVE
jgi:ribulokinase